MEEEDEPYNIEEEKEDMSEGETQEEGKALYDKNLFNEELLGEEDVDFD
jgi:hypothetical protein